MFDFLADILTATLTTLLPVFLTYKALRTSDPTLLAPWLIYWVILSLLHIAENFLSPILTSLPFWAWIRLWTHLYLVLPGQQGAIYIYHTYLYPFLEEHERYIDRVISDTHARAKEAGLDAVKGAWEWVRVQMLGQPPAPPSPPPPPKGVSYSTYLMERIAMPSARTGLAAAGGGTADLFGLIGRALQQTTTTTGSPSSPKTPEQQAQDLSQSGTLVPPDLAGEARRDFISTQRERLNTLLRAFDYEAEMPAPRSTSGSGSASGAARPSDSELRVRGPPPPRSPVPRYPSGGSGSYAGMHKSRSESEFEDLAFESMPDPEDYRVAGSQPGRGADVRRSGGGGSSGGAGWSSWIWGNYGEKDSAVDRRKDD